MFYFACNRGLSIDTIYSCAWVTVTEDAKQFFLNKWENYALTCKWRHSASARRGATFLARCEVNAERYDRSRRVVGPICFAACWIGSVKDVIYWTKWFLLHSLAGASVKWRWSHVVSALLYCAWYMCLSLVFSTPSQRVLLANSFTGFIDWASPATHGPSRRGQAGDRSLAGRGTTAGSTVIGRRADTLSGTSGHKLNELCCARTT